MDPFSLATGVAGLIGLAMDLALLIGPFIGDIKDEPENVKMLKEELDMLANALKLLSNTQAISQGDTTQTSVINSAVTACKNLLESVQKKLSKVSDAKGVAHVLRRLKFPLDKKEISELVQKLHRYTELIHFALTVEGR
jgi:ankyrin repeat domain-containing protein 50